MPAIETVIINCSTKEQTTLALLSAVTHGGLPVAVIDCESTDGSFDFFERLKSRVPFALRRMPLRAHGATLDRIFSTTECEALLLLDSDAEITRSDLVPRMIDALHDDTYGSGFIHAGQWLGANHLVAGRVGYYAPRMWIPCVLLRVAPLRDALNAGRSFAARTIGNELARMPWLSQLLYLRFRVPWLRDLQLETLRSRHGEYFGERPHYIYFDTGALMHRYLCDAHGFADLGMELWDGAVRHRHGVTRKRLKRGMRNAADFETSKREAVDRIANVYHMTLPELHSQS